MLLFHDLIASARTQINSRKSFERPSYGPDLSPCDHHLFGLLKEAVKGEKFENGRGILARLATY